MNRGRPRQFDSQTALHQAMLVFWRNGYRGTSMDDLTQALQINKPSLYAAFGDKEQLFLKVVDYYREKMIVPAATKMLEHDNIKDGLNAFFEALSHVVMENETPPGCMVACLLSEECCESEQIKEKLAGIIDGADQFFLKMFQKHEGELNPAMTPQSASVLLVSCVHGLSIRARSGASRERLNEGAQAFMTAVLARS